MELGNQLDISQGCVIEKKKGLDASQLKIIALVTMLIDHIGAIIIPFLQGYNNLPENCIPIVRSLSIYHH